MNIIEKTYTLNGTLQKRSKTDTIFLHHRAGSGDVESIDRAHKNNDWTCIGYHFYVRKDGSVYRGRREDTIGAHAYGHNNTSIGICAEGNYEVEMFMPEAQKKAIIELIAYIKGKYPITSIKRHRDVNSTACPGKNYPFDEIVNGTPTPQKEVTGTIATIQKTLNTRYGLNITVDNVAGPETKKAIVIGLQKEHNKQFERGLVVDGVFGIKTHTACEKLRIGAKGNITYLLQARLACLGYNTNGVDGVFGNGTLNAVKQFQKAKGIVVDGVVGQVTWGKLFY
jgi:N-acetyl-anhydromuramyl-L-alanine amidase AmpD